MRPIPMLVAPAVLAALALTLSACVSTSPTGTPTQPPANPSTSAAPSASPSAQLQTLGPLGYGALRLGSTKADARASGLADGLSGGSKGFCGSNGDGWLKAGPVPTDEVIAGMLFFSATTGKLVAIYAVDGVATPQGIKLGSSVSELKAAYPDWVGGDGDLDNGWADTPGNAKAHYRIVVRDDKVVELSLDSDDQDCYE
jgi:hypothetical protein